MNDKSRRIPDWLADIQLAIANIYSDVGNASKNEFLADGKTQRAVIKGLIDMGEASKSIMELDTSLKQGNPALWQHFKDVYAMRIRLTHSYHRIDESVVFDTVKNHLPTFEALLHSFVAADASPHKDTQPPRQ